MKRSNLTNVADTLLSGSVGWLPKCDLNHCSAIATFRRSFEFERLRGSDTAAVSSDSVRN